MAKTFDPLQFIPSASAVRERLQHVQEQARKLRVLLKTAEKIERGTIQFSASDHQPVEAAK